MNPRSRELSAHLLLPAPQVDGGVRHNGVVEVPPVPRLQGKRSTVYGNDLNSSDILPLGGDYDLRQIVAAEYGFNRDFIWEYPEAFSTTSRKIIINDGQHHYYIKEKPKYCCNPYSLALSAQLQEFLASKVGFVPQIVHTNRGDYYLRIRGNYFFTTVYIKGRLFSSSIIDVQSAGETLGIIHSYSEDFSFPDPRNLCASEDTLQFVDLAEQLPRAGNDPYREETILELRGLVHKYDGKVDKGATYIANHGDYAPFNLVYDHSGRVVAVNDFDNVNFRPRTRDLAGAIISFCDGLSYAGATSSLRIPIATALNIEKVAAFVEGYTENAAALSEKEKTDLIGEACIRWVKIMALGIVRGDFNYEDVLNSLAFPEFIEKRLPALI
ncbi:MAG: phosphotransferase [Candidatus Shapirobacteria bacterium]|jgi:hypothetical protein